MDDVISPVVLEKLLEDVRYDQEFLIQMCNPRGNRRERDIHGRSKKNYEPVVHIAGYCEHLSNTLLFSPKT